MNQMQGQKLRPGLRSRRNSLVRHERATQVREALWLSQQLAFSCGRRLVGVFQVREKSRPGGVQPGARLNTPVPR